MIVSLDRANPFDLKTYGSLGWAIEEQDDRSLALTELDLGKIKLLSMHRPGETSLSRQGFLSRLKREGHIRLDAKVLQVLFENKSLIPGAWKKLDDDDRIIPIFFDGTIFRTSEGHLCSLHLFWGYDASWHWLPHRLDLDSGPSDVSATLPHLAGSNRQ